ncbi:hypothetical protein BU26DRAFT_31978 [Trematosphaeria pertusa]|uniref:Uncharacterized protein n=1 Tax=Trematosphaeria pertusa TaxID=390896 RepID=A0A6A6J3I7_9PLEO|nr:uncharacterized protein BU26DRAFT_31978 [Trematosphaeria pertusa]KAF2256917.1 hypothetical protein BU26DRAFT_31978 [Trematosphaeria pertusa]
MELPRKEQILATFDQLVSEGIVIYGPHRVIEEDCEGYLVEFRVCPSQAKKPNIVGAALGPTFDTSRKWGPGSDMYCIDERLKIARLNDTHDLALNLFCVDRPQLLILTLNSYLRQHEPMDRSDFEAALKVLTSMDDTYIIYNCGEAAGCSRVHKHLQGLLGPPRAFESFTGDEEKRLKVPFRHFTHHFPEGFHTTSASNLLDIYRALLDQARGCLNLPEADSPCPHNVILWKGWMIVIPRRAAWVGQASANAGGMMGSIWVSEQRTVDEWLRLGCRNILGELGVPA